MEGWIMLHRKIQDSAIWSDSQAVHLWVNLLLKANHADNEFMRNGALIKVKRGQVLTGRKSLSAETGINESKIQRLLKVFEKCHMIEQQANNRSRLLSILNYDQYQASEQQANNKRTASEQPVNTNNNDNNYNNTKKEILSIGERTSEFKELTSTNWARLGGESYLIKSEVAKFFSYWCEKSDKGKKMRFEMAKNQPFDMGRRLGTWKKGTNTENNTNLSTRP